MPKISSSGISLGDVVKHEYGKEWGYCRETVTVTLTPTSKIGDVLSATAGGVYSLVTVATTATTAGVLVDPNVLNLRPSSGTVNVQAAVLVDGPAVIGDDLVNYGADVDTNAEKLAVLARLRLLRIKARKQV